MNWNLKDAAADFFWPLGLQSTNAGTLSCSAFSPCRILLLKPLLVYVCILSLKLPQFCCLGRYYFGNDSWCSSYLLQVIYFFFFLLISVSFASLGLTPTKSWTEFSGNIVTGYVAGRTWEWALVLTLWKVLLEETHVLTKQEGVGKGWVRVESSRIRKPGRTALPRGPPSHFMVIGLLSRLSLPNHSHSGSFLVACTSLSPDGFHWEEFWEIGRTFGLESLLSLWPFLNSSNGW